MTKKSKLDRRTALGLMGALPLLGAASPTGAAVKPDRNSRPASNGKKYRAIVDTHRHVVGPKLAAKMAERGLYDPKRAFPQTNPLDFVCYRDFIDLDYAMPKQRKGGVTRASLATAARWSGLRTTYFKSARATPSSS